MALAALRLRKGARFTYEYDLNIPWRHEVRIENQFGLEASKTYPVCTKKLQDSSRNRGGK